MRKIETTLKGTIITGVLSFFAAFLLLMAAIPKEDNYFTIKFTPQGVHNYNILHHSEKTPENSAGEYTITPFMYLEAGDYAVDMEYTAEEATPVYLYSMSEYDTASDMYPATETGSLNPQQNSTSLSFSLEEGVKQAVLVMDYKAQGNVSLKECTVRSTEPVYRNREITALFTAFAVAAFCMLVFYIASGKADNKKEKIAVAVVVAAMAAVTSAGLLKYDIIMGDDLEFHLLRILGIAENITQGAPMCRVNFAFNGGYGYLNPVFYPQLFLWPFALLVAAGADTICAYKLLVLSINIATAVISYLCFKKISCCTAAATVASAVYMLNYYRIGNIYIRSAIGELLFLVFLPIVFYGIYEIFHKGENKWYILAIGAGCVLQSHILGTVLTAIGGAILIGYYLTISIVKKDNILKQLTALVKAGIAVVGANLWFLVPMLYYIRQPFSLFGNIDSVERFYSYSRPLSDMLFRVKDFTYATIISHLGIGTGVFFIVMAAAVCVYMFRTKKLHEAAGLVLIAVVLLICATDIMPWDKLGTIGIVEAVVTKLQFSFRLNTLTTAFLALAAAVLFRDIRISAAKPAGMAFSCILVVLAGCYYSLNGYETVKGYEGSFAISGLSPPEYLMQGAAYHQEAARTDKFRTSSDSVEITEYSRIGAGIQVNVSNSSSQQEYIELPLLYYSGYTAQCSGSAEPLAVTTGENFVVRVELPAGTEGSIAVKFANKWFFNAAALISIVFTALLICLTKSKKYLVIKEKILKKYKIFYLQTANQMI